MEELVDELVIWQRDIFELGEVSYPGFVQGRNI